MGLREKVERIMMAITFAEAGQQDTAREFLRGEKRLRKEKRLGKRTRPRKVLRAPPARR